MNIYEELNILNNKIALKNKRNKILGETDKYILADFPITPEQLEVVKEYRQKLRDFTQNNYELPIKPDFIIILS